MKKFLILLFMISTLAYSKPIIKFGFDKLPLFIDMMDYQWNSETMDQYNWCKLRLTIYF